MHARGLIVLLVMALGLLQYRLWWGSGGIAELRALKAQQVEYRAELARLAARNRALAAEVESLKNDYAAIEERARFDLGMIRNGELFLQLIEPAAPPAPSAAAPLPTKRKPDGHR